MIKLQFLVEDTKIKNSALSAEHGLSIYVETENLKFVFDCGQTDIAWKNAQKLGINLSEINFAVISHAHYDHAGGFPSLLNFAKPKKIFTGKNFWQEKFSVSDGDFKYRGAGFTAENLKSWNIEQKICEDFLQVDENIFLLGNFEKNFDFEKIPEKFVCGEEKIQDNFDDEICLALKNVSEIILIVGCSHAGILNIVSTVQKKFKLPVKTLIGGIHLLGAEDLRIIKTLTELKNFGVKKFYFCHCSGVTSANKISTGTILNF